MSTRRTVLFIPIEGYIEGRGWRVSIVEENVAGHTPTGTWPYEGKPGQTVPWFVPGKSYEEAQGAVAVMNEARFGISRQDATLIVLSSMSRGSSW